MPIVSINTKLVHCVSVKYLKSQGVVFLVRFWWHFWQHKILNMPSGDRGRELNINRPESSPKPLPVIVMTMIMGKMLMIEVI